MAIVKMLTGLQMTEIYVILDHTNILLMVGDVVDFSDNV